MALIERPDVDSMLYKSQRFFFNMQCISHISNTDALLLFSLDVLGTVYYNVKVNRLIINFLYNFSQNHDLKTTKLRPHRLKSMAGTINTSLKPRPEKIIRKLPKAGISQQGPRAKCRLLNRLSDPLKHSISYFKCRCFLSSPKIFIPNQNQDFFWCLSKFEA